jgi:hypothetical protein
MDSYKSPPAVNIRRRKPCSVSRICLASDGCAIEVRLALIDFGDTREVIVVIRIGQLWILVVFLSAMAHAQKQTSLKIYVYNNAAVPEAVVNQAEARTRKIFLRSRVATTWNKCSIQDSAGQDCSGLLDPDVVVVQLVHDTGTFFKDEVFGAAFLGNDGHGSYTDVYFDRAQELCRELKVSLPELLGHIIAHEMGHLLLGSNAHSPLGIMRATWRRTELELASKGDLLFSAGEAKTMQARLRAIESAAVTEAAISPQHSAFGIQPATVLVVHNSHRMSENAH